MILIFGLGNPGQKFEKTRHNIGSRVINNLQSLNLENVVLAKPTTYMNESGKAVKKLISNYQLPISNLFVIHDDIDLPLGKIKISKGRGAGGHKGVESIIRELKTKNFVRFRIGICPKTDKPPTKNMVGGKPKNIEKFVLQKFNIEEEKIVKKIIKKTAKAIEFSLRESLEKAMQKYNV